MDGGKVDRKGTSTSDEEACRSQRRVGEALDSSRVQSRSTPAVKLPTPGRQ